MTNFETVSAVERLRNPFELIALAQKGVLRSKVDEVAKQFALTDRELARILNISERTLHRLRPDARLDASTSEKLLKLVLLYQHGIEVFDTIASFNEWMKQKLRILGDKSPMEMLDTATGMEYVDNVLGRIEWGVYS